MVFNRLGEILLVRHSYLSGWHLPGGGVDRGETVLEAAYREVFEETGINQLNFEKLHDIHLNFEDSGKDHIIFFVMTTDEEPQLQKNLEIVEVKFFSINDLPKDTHDSIRSRLDKINEQQNTIKFN